MTRFLTFLLVVLFALPSVVYAHASPTEYIPASSATVTEAPSEISIRFSERPEAGASRIVVKDERGVELQQGTAVVDSLDSRVLSIPLTEGEAGAYFVTWSVVSKDDGHFTKGGYTYFIGDKETAGTNAPPQVEVVQLSALPEASTIALELLGNSLLLASLVFFAFLVRPRLQDMDEKARRGGARVHTFLVVCGIFFALAGAVAHVLLKTSELATLHSSSFTEALPLYLATVGGFATIIRAGVVIVFGLFFAFRARAIRTASRITFSELALFVLLGVFAYFRAVVSHATANPFLPPLGVFTNFVHLIAKDLSAGLLITLSLVMALKSLRPHLPHLAARGMRTLALLFAPLSATAAYIVWLHLKDASNLTSTLWGERAILLFTCALAAAAFLAYHAWGSRYAPAFVGRMLRYTLPAEAVVGVLIVFFSSLMIITSPPLHEAPHALTAESNGVHISLMALASEDGMALLTVAEPDMPTVHTPTVLLDGDSEGGIVLDLEERFVGGYAFPLAVLQGEETHTLSIIASQEGGYDARASFTLTRADLILPAEGVRTFDLFTLLMSALGIAGVLFALLLLRSVRTEHGTEVTPSSPLRVLVSGVATLFIASQLLGIASFAFANTFKRECIQDGNSWHLMLPTRAGKPVSSTPAEGCMALNGAFHIADAREYHFLKSPAVSHVEFSTDLSVLRAGEPIELAFAMRNEDGSIPHLSVQHERLVHIVVVSKDATQFFHVHPDDSVPLTTEEVANASFTIPFTFPKAGEYVIGIDYASGLSLRSEQFRMSVAGAPMQEERETFPLRAMHEGYAVSLQPGFPIVGQPATLVWRVQKDGEDVLDLEPYLGAATHVAIVKEDLSEFIHAHGEVHMPNAPVPKVSATGVHNHVPPPPRFGPLVEAHPVFPSAGIYTVFAQFMHEGKVISAPFTLRVE